MEYHDMKVNDLIQSLQKTYPNQSKYAIDKSLKSKYNLKTVKREDYIKELKSINNLTGTNINQDIMYNLLLQSDYNTLKELCLTNKVAVKICQDDNFWRNKLVQDYKLIKNKNYKDTYIKAVKAEKCVNDILHMNRIEVNRFHKATDGIINIINNEFYKSVPEFLEKTGLSLDKKSKYRESIYEVSKIQFQLKNDKYICRIILYGESKYLSDAITLTVTIPFSRIKALLIYFVYEILFDEQEYLECVDDEGTPFIFEKKFNTNDYKHLYNRKYFDSAILFLRRGIWEGLNL